MGGEGGREREGDEEGMKLAILPTPAGRFQKRLRQLFAQDKCLYFGERQQQT